MLRLDHAVIFVDDLAAASSDFGLLGFTVVYGGEHEALGTHNALIPFEDGSYIELIALRRRSEAAPKSAAADRWSRWTRRGEGLVGFALVPDDIEAAVAASRERGLALLGPIPGGRKRPDGVEVSWQLALAESSDLPFLCADVTPRGLRVPEGLARAHPNGAVGIQRVVVAVSDMGASMQRYRALTGADPERGGATWRLGSTAVELVRTAGEEGPSALEIATRTAERLGPLDPARTHGAAIALVGA